MIAASELILRDDGSIYHLGLVPGQVAEDIITVGDPDRVTTVAAHLDIIELDVQLREFRTVTGTRQGRRWTIISTGIGTDNIDIVFNEVDALFNVDLERRQIKQEHTALRFYRLGTSGTIREDIPVDSMIASAYAVDLGPMPHYYAGRIDEAGLSRQVQDVLVDHSIQHVPTSVTGSSTLLGRLPKDIRNGITFTAPGFYAPQGRSIRLRLASASYLDELSAVTYKGYASTNLEMETAGIYFLARMLGHEAISISAILANRKTGAFSTQAAKTVEEMIEWFFGVYG